MNNMSEREDFSGLAELQKTLVDATEVMAAFISTGRSEELPIASLIEAAEKTSPDLQEWRKTIEVLAGVVQRNRTSRTKNPD